MTKTPRDHERVRWGILGTGWIADRFARALSPVEGAVVRAIGSRSEDRAQAFAQRHGLEKAYGSYEALVGDPEVDVVYVATPAPRHRDDCLLCLEAGRPVLCEKPFACDAGEAEEIVAMARRRSLFCMEAMVMRFFPLMQRARDLVRSGHLGEVKFVRAEIGERHLQGRDNRLLRPELGGGARLDLLVYPVSLAHFLFGPPSGIAAAAAAHPFAAVDETTSVILRYPGLVVAASASIGTAMANEAVIHGSARRLHLAPCSSPTRIGVAEVNEVAMALPAARAGWRRKVVAAVPFRPALRASYARLRAGAAALTGRGRGGMVQHAPAGINGLRLEAEEVMRCLRAGERESPLMPLDETIQVLETLDAVKALAAA